jgi:hypothetical protein
MKVRLRHGDLHLLDLRTRMPFKYGIATMTSTPHLFVRLRADIDGLPAVGLAADHLPPKWFTKDPDRPVADEVNDMLRVIEHALRVAVGLGGDSVFDVWKELLRVQSYWGLQEHLPPLLTQFGVALVERALIDALCRVQGVSLGQALRKNLLGIRLGDVHDSLSIFSPRDLLPKRPLAALWVRHTVGLADPLEDADVAPPERLDDGLPQSLAACIDVYGLRHFKIKVTGEVERDRDRLRRVAAVLRDHASANFAFSLDGNEAFRSVAALRSYWQVLRPDPELQDFWAHLLFVEQPLHREAALAPLAYMKAGWKDRPPLIIDESDAEMSSLWQALFLGYDGTSHKNCKGVIKSVINACWLALLRQGPHPHAVASVEEDVCWLSDLPPHDLSRPLILSGEDLANIGPVALPQDLAVCATLGIESVERNGHHYFAGLSMFPAEIQRQVLAAHGDLYHAGPHGWPTLTIVGGRLRLDSVVQAPFGIAPMIDVEQFTPLARWRETHPS